jgi:hypothetical protein
VQTVRNEYVRRRGANRATAEQGLLRADGHDRFESFADEVAIDFPSIAVAVDRMRDAFLGPDEPGRPLSAEIMLSRREALDGAIVPLDVPVRRVCPSCGGRGETWAEPCGPCDGTGEALGRHLVRLIVPPHVVDGVRFHLRVSSPFAPLTRVEVRVAVR